MVNAPVQAFGALALINVKTHQAKHQAVPVEVFIRDQRSYLVD